MTSHGIVFDFKRFAVHDGDGIRTTVFLKGCPLRCRWCHNPEGIDRRPELAYRRHKCLHCGRCVAACPHGAHEMTPDGHVFRRDRCVACGACVAACPGRSLQRYGTRMSVDDVMDVVLHDRDFYAQSGGGVTLSGGEPLLQSEFCADILRQAKREGLHTAVDTCGFVDWSAFERVLPVTDLFLFDLKPVDDEVHREYVGQSNARIHENLWRLDETGIPIEIRMLLIPGINSCLNDLHAYARVLADLRNVRTVRVLGYHDLARPKYRALGLVDTMPHAPSPDSDEIEAAQRSLGFA